MMLRAIPTATDDPINRAILTVSEDQISGFAREPFAAIAQRAGVPVETVLERIAAMLEAGVIRRVRQTLITTKLARGALVAWQVPEDKLNAAFDWLHANDPFTGHVVIRSTDAQTPGAMYRLWTTLKVPPQYTLETHCGHLARRIEAERYRIMPAKKLFKLGVGHMRRRSIQPGDRAARRARPHDTELVELTGEQWDLLWTLKRELSAHEITRNLWAKRAAELDMDFERFCTMAEELDGLGVIGRFSTFLEHVKKVGRAEPVARYNGLFHWAVPPGRELEAGGEVGRHHIMTHAYWREGGPEFNHVNIMGVAHGADKQRVLEHKAAIDAHLEEAGIPVTYTAVFWGGRSEVTPSELSPDEYRQWAEQQGLDARASHT
ncbi:MAG: Lrp/AsnC family transcriptional regulator [Planctomycetes bacterium]|jgi:hypothetical protein|nr:Lrp/AsnC family transcriptional regulator [Planctomycetota bacterium]